MRHKIIHDYFGVDHEVVWVTAVEELPELKQDVQEILDQTSSP